MIEPGAFSQAFYEFFAGSGMVRAGLGASWKCIFANDFDEKKAASYERNWGKGELLVRDIAKVASCELPGYACGALAG
jgi:DNA (cytosine-5)-methyltransferase 1